jgi:transposase
VEVVRPNRQARRRNGKSDSADAEAAAGAVLSGEASGCPKAGDDLVEMIRVLRVARSTAVKARTQAINALKAILITAPVENLRGLSRSRDAALVMTTRMPQMFRRPCTGDVVGI